MLEVSESKWLNFLSFNAQVVLGERLRFVIGLGDSLILKNRLSCVKYGSCEASDKQSSVLI